jgi:hypothetical protein
MPIAKSKFSPERRQQKTFRRQLWVGREVGFNLLCHSVIGWFERCTQTTPSMDTRDHLRLLRNGLLDSADAYQLQVSQAVCQRPTARNLSERQAYPDVSMRRIRQLQERGLQSGKEFAARLSN